MTAVKPTRPIGVLIVDDHDGYRSIAAEVVDAAPGFGVAGSAADRTQALGFIEDLAVEVDLVLMDVNLGADDGIGLSEEIMAQVSAADRALDIVLVTSFAVDDLPRSARTCGARGYLPKSELSPATLEGLCAGVYDWPDGNTTGRAG